VSLLKDLELTTEIKSKFKHGDVKTLVTKMIWKVVRSSLKFNTSRKTENERK
jgi:hypothetical protein